MPTPPRSLQVTQGARVRSRFFSPIFCGRVRQSHHTRWITVTGTTPKTQCTGRIPLDRPWTNTFVHGRTTRAQADAQTGGDATGAITHSTMTPRPEIYHPKRDPARRAWSQTGRLCPPFMSGCHQVFHIGNTEEYGGTEQSRVGLCFFGVRPHSLGVARHTREMESAPRRPQKGRRSTSTRHRLSLQKGRPKQFACRPELLQGGRSAATWRR